MAGNRISAMAKSVCHVERNLKWLGMMPRVTPTNIKDFYGAKKRKKRRGRGPNQSHGRGNKGQGHYSNKPRLGFEGGQSPFYRMVPKHGLVGELHTDKHIFATVNLNKLQFFIDSKRIDPSKPITLELMKSTMLLEGTPRDGVRLMGEGHTWFQGKIDIEVTRASQDAITAVERNGGSVRCVWHDRVMLQHVMQSEPSKNFSVVPPVPKRPGPNLLLYYANPRNRGYLANPEELAKLREENVKLGPVVDKLKEMKISEVD